MTPPSDPVESHYESGDLSERILDALRQMGRDPNHLTQADLMSADQFHTRGLSATRDLAELAAFSPGLEVVDVGCGLGGPARYLAAEYNCRVTGVDIVAEFCSVAEMLTERVGLADRVTFRHASALELPFPEGQFDAAWTFQAQMNIADKPAFYAEIFRVLKPGGRLVFQDIFQGEGGEVHLPLPWAAAYEINHLVPPGQAREIIEKCGFLVLDWRNTTRKLLDWYAKQKACSDKPPPPLGIHLVLGPDARAKVRNQKRNAVENRLVWIQAVAQKPA